MVIKEIKLKKCKKKRWIMYSRVEQTWPELYDNGVDPG